MNVNGECWLMLMLMLVLKASVHAPRPACEQDEARSTHTKLPPTTSVRAAMPGKAQVGNMRFVVNIGHYSQQQTVLLPRALKVSPTMHVHVHVKQ